MRKTSSTDETICQKRATVLVRSGHLACRVHARECPRAASGLVEEPALADAGLVLGGDVDVLRASRNTLAVTRSILPRRPKDRPAAKSTRRLASASSISVRFMITGMPSRKCSPMVRASLYVRGCSVVIR